MEVREGKATGSFMRINPYEASELPDLIIRLQGLAKYKLISKNKILKDIRNVRHKLYLEEFGNE